MSTLSSGLWALKAPAMHDWLGPKVKDTAYILMPDFRNTTCDPHSLWNERKILSGFGFALKHMLQALYAINPLQVFL